MVKALSTRRDVTRATAQGVPVASVLVGAQTADVALVRALLAAGALPNDITGSTDGRTALAEAVIRPSFSHSRKDTVALLDGSLLVVKRLLKAGADTRKRDVLQVLPIKGVAMTGDLRVADAILAAEKTRGIPLVDDECVPEEAEWLRGVAASVEAFRAGGAPLLPEQLRQQSFNILPGIGLGSGATLSPSRRDEQGTLVDITMPAKRRPFLEVQENSVAGVQAAMGEQAVERCAATGCGAAGADTLRFCAACLTVRYCSSSCQRAHWPEHKPACKAAQAKKRGGAAR